MSSGSRLSVWSSSPAPGGNKSASAKAMKTLLSSAALFTLVTLSAGCVVSGKIQPTVAPGAPVDVSRLWEEPADLASRDLFHGPGGAALAPDPSTPFTFVQ